MKKRIAICIVLGIFLNIYSLVKTSESKEDASPEKTNQMIHDSTLYKFIILDSAEYISGFIGWEEREELGWGRTALLKATEKILSKYGFDITKSQEAKGNLPTPFVAGFSSTDEGPQFYIEIPNKWCELCSLPIFRELPSIKYKSGKLLYNPKSMHITFDEGTHVMVDDKEYVFTQGKFSKFQVSKP